MIGQKLKQNSKIILNFRYDTIFWRTILYFSTKNVKCERSCWLWNSFKKWFQFHKHIDSIIRNQYYHMILSSTSSKLRHRERWLLVQNEKPYFLGVIYKRRRLFWTGPIYCFYFCYIIFLFRFIGPFYIDLRYEKLHKYTT